ncbi:MAG: C10 family peptidase, partial [Muribaculaceae bacterium]|nr:C10 family peptidase [Muribaculaceae bacterium]
DGQQMVYVFNTNNDGFIVVSADDSMTSLLGYSDKGIFDPANVSPAFKWWLSQYAEEAAYANKVNLLESASNDSATTRSESSDLQAIPNLITTQWGQEYPFNLDCPQIGNEKTVTGCVATAMAQIIKYHNYPASGNDTNSYEWNNTELSFDYANSSFQYDLMADNYSQSQSAESNEAVAKLLLACGVGVNMNYGLEESGASDMYIAYTLRHYFNYDNGVKYLKRNFFTADQWENLIYSELLQKRPVIYGGQAPKGGHQFICDGYDGNGYFHINWGWNGHGDGHFLLSALNPEFQGVGGFEGGYNSDQTIVCGIQPPVANSEIWYPIYASSNLQVAELTSTTVNIDFQPGALWNYSQQPVDVEIILSAMAEDGTEYISEPRSILYFGEEEPTTIYHFDGAQDNSIRGRSYIYLNLPKDLPEGNYKCSPVIKTPEGNIQKVYFPTTAVSYFNLAVSASGEVTSSPGIPEETPLIEVTRFEPVTDVIQGAPTQFYITIENSGDTEFSGTIEYRIYKDGIQVNDQYLGISIASLQSGASATYLYTETYSFDPGTYDFIFYDIYGKQISNPFSITIGDSGVESMLSESEAIDIYSAGGMLIKSNAGKDFISTLPKGIYVLKAKGKSITILK